MVGGSSVEFTQRCPGILMEKAKNILVEASGSPVSAYMIRAIQNAGHSAVASDITDECVGNVLADDFMLVPPSNDVSLWEVIEDGLFKHNIDVVIPSFDKTLLGWAERKGKLIDRGVSVLVSPANTINTFADKWKSYCFFNENNIPCARTSLNPDYPVLKPRRGSGGSGFQVYEDVHNRRRVFSEGWISQELIGGIEYTVDCLFDADGVPVYIIPRRRMNISDGKSLGGITERHSIIIDLVKEISRKTFFVGPINFQFFDHKGDVKIIEINCRLAGGGALGFASSENWVPLMLNISEGSAVSGGDVRWGTRMMRYYSEIIQF